MFEGTSCCEVKETGSTGDKDRSLRSDPLKKYLAEIRRYPVLTREEEMAISRLVFEHQDPTAIQKLTVSNLRLVVALAREYHNRNINIFDLIQEGNVGLLRAVKKYNPHKGTRFSTYASFWIRAHIFSHIVNSWSLVKVGTTEGQRKLFFKLNGEKGRLEALGIDPTAKLLASNFGVNEWDIEDMLKILSSTDMALDGPTHDGSDETFMDRLSSDEDVEEIVSERHKTVLLSKKLKEFKATLDDRDLYIFNKRLVADEPMSLQEIGDNYRISRERVRQVETRIVKRFRTHCQGSFAELDLQNANGKDGATEQVIRNSRIRLQWD